MKASRNTEHPEKSAAWLSLTVKSTPRATIEFDKVAWIKAQAPCNRFSVRQKAPYPWFDVGPAVATKMACPDLKSERVFFNALSDMSLSEVFGDTLVLNNNAGHTMVFKAQ